MLPFFTRTRLWLLILCLVGNGFLPLGALANTRIWSQGMDICFSAPAESQSTDSNMRHPLCCCHMSNDSTALPTPEYQYRITAPDNRLTLAFKDIYTTDQPFGHIRVRGPPAATGSI